MYVLMYMHASVYVSVVGYILYIHATAHFDKQDT